MISDTEIYQSASALIREHADEAAQEAAKAAESYRRKGDMDGHALFKRIEAAVVELQKKAPSPDDTIQ